jgi:hypothetical protein
MRVRQSEAARYADQHGYEFAAEEDAEEDSRTYLIMHACGRRLWPVAS